MTENKMDWDAFDEELEQELLDSFEEEPEAKSGKKSVQKKQYAPQDFNVSENGRLLDFLLAVMDGKSRTTVKSYLSHRQIAVNGTVTTRFDQRLRPGDRVSLNREMTKEPFRHPMLSIVYEDDDLIVVNKRNGLLSMGTDRERAKTAYYILSEYLKSQDRSERIFIVHRLDRETSGLMIFAKSIEVQHKLQQNWSELVLERKYVAVVSNAPHEESGTCSSYLAENKAFVVYSTSDPEAGELAVTHYTVLKQGGGNSLVELELETGKKNQIRVHMKDMGCPIVGDRKYGGVISPIGRIALHARLIRFIHPVTGREMCFDTGIPGAFLQLLKKKPAYR